MRPYVPLGTNRKGEGEGEYIIIKKEKQRKMKNGTKCEIEQGQICSALVQ